MKNVIREDFRVRVVLAADSPQVLGLPVEGHIVSGRVELVIEPKRLGDFGFGVMSDSLVSSDPQAAYERRAEEMARELRWQKQVKSAQVECTVREECSHCRRPWSELTAEDIAKHSGWLDEEDVPGRPQCCDKAQTEFAAAQKAGA